MATIPTYTTYVAGTVVTASNLNAQIRDAGNFLINTPYCCVYNNAGVSLTNSAYTLIPWDFEVDDNDGMHSTSVNPSRVIFQTLGAYQLVAYVGLPTSTVATIGVQMRLNSGGSNAGGTMLAAQATVKPTTVTGNTPGLIYPHRVSNIGDYVETFADQTSGGAVTSGAGLSNTRFSAKWQNA